MDAAGSRICDRAAADAAAEPVLEVADLTASLTSATGRVQALRGVNLRLARGEVLGLVGESGSGKTVTMLAVLGLLPDTARISGSVRFGQQELLGRTGSELRRLRGRRIGMIFQNPSAALNPLIAVGAQIAEGIRAHRPTVGRRQAAEQAVELLGMMGVPDPRRRVRDFPHQLSGGLCQRVVIAMAMANDPEVLIADEPTTALDVTIQAQILDLLRTVTAERGLSVVLISHDLGVVAGLADRVAVMYAGRIVEDAPVRELYRRPRHPYTRGLLASVPRIGAAARRALESPNGAAPSLHRLPSGCTFRPRCSSATPVCAESEPSLRPVGRVHVACHHAATPAPREAP